MRWRDVDLGTSTMYVRDSKTEKGVPAVHAARLCTINEAARPACRSASVSSTTRRSIGQRWAATRPLRFPSRLRSKPRSHKRAPIAGASREADDGTRTHDLLHGKQTL